MAITDLWNGKKSLRWIGNVNGSGIGRAFFGLLFLLNFLRCEASLTETLFEQEKVDLLLEIGSSEQTGFFIDQCSHVTTLELLIKETRVRGVNAYFDALEKYGGAHNWELLLHPCSQKINAAHSIAWQNLDPYYYDPSYLEELELLISGLFNKRPYDAVYVHPQLFLHGDLISLLFGHVDIIVSIGGERDFRKFGWYKCEEVPHYARLSFPDGFIWIHERKQALIDRLSQKLSGQ